MYLKSLTLRGFKSFASSTTLRFEPGMTCVVGPNGSGKSNVVDAVAWVLGEQGAKSLRGSAMEDVIFAGTGGRDPLGRAQVVLVIDNSDGALPIDYSEVTISRLMFRSGNSEYAINGTPCRLLDVQDLLSDSGIGREMHVIVGQGQLDSVLAARPEERRGFVEEAAGVLKHRKRKEKALRKLDALAGNVTQLTDLTAELSRQLKPLGRQAEVARKAATIQAELRDASLRLLADDLHRLRTDLAADLAAEAAARARRGQVEAELASAQAREAELDATLAAAAPTLESAQDIWYRLSALAERLAGTASLGAERARQGEAGSLEAGAMQSGAPPVVGIAGRDPDQIDAEVAAIRAEHAALAEELDRSRVTAAAKAAARERIEADLASEEHRLAEQARAVAQHRQNRAKLAGDAGALQSRVTAAHAEIGRLKPALDDARRRAAETQAEFTASETDVAGLDENEVDLDERYETAAAKAEASAKCLAALKEEVRRAEQDRSAARARREALALSSPCRAGAAALMDAADRLPGLRGPVAAVIAVEPGYERACAAALGAAADGIVADSLATAVAALDLLKASNGGRAGIVVESGSPVARRPDPPAGTRWAADVIQAPGRLGSAISRMLAGIAVTDDLRRARAIVESAPDIRVATADGDLVGGEWAAGGAGDTGEVFEVQAAAAEAERALAEVEHHCERLRFEVAAVTEEHDGNSGSVDAALEDLNRSDARMSEVVERLGQLSAQARAADGEAGRLAQAIAEAEAGCRADTEELHRVEARLAAHDPEVADDGELDTARRAELSSACALARDEDTEAKLAVRTHEERAQAAAARADELDASAAAERERRQRLAAARQQQRRDARTGTAVAAVSAYALSLMEASLAAAQADRDAAQRARSARERELLTLRARARELSADLDELVGAEHRDDVARTEQRLRVEALAARAREEFGLEPEALIAQYGPDVAVPLATDAGHEDAGRPPPPSGQHASDSDRSALPSVPYDRTEQEKRARARRHALDQLGKVNPLALEEYDALCERHRFLADQLADLNGSRRDLLTVINEVDERVEQVFAEAFADTAAEFEQVFATLFPGGEGRLVLTEPNDLLATGIDVEARPPGKRVKRLSLLSGGERSLVAIALLVAIFRARPSPFYVLDEIEAALDDANLGRLIGLLRDLCTASQLLVVTHQKRTMQAADALYGVSMRDDGVTTVISQRLRELETA